MVRTVSCWKVLLIVAVLILGTANVWAQGFMVKPLSFKVHPYPGKMIEKELELRNTKTDKAITLMIYLVPLGETKQGVWRVVNPKEETKTPSCLEWTKLSSKKVQIQPGQSEKVTVKVQVPRSARGFYGAGILVQGEAKHPEGRIGLMVRFLVPILVEIRGPIARQDIRLTDVNMKYLKRTEETKEATIVSMDITNKGETYSSVRGQINIFYQRGEHWSRATKVEIPKRGIIPGVSLSLSQDIGRKLPSGKYRLQGLLWVDDRLRDRTEKEIDFEGAPDITEVASDITLMTEVSLLTLKAGPGSMRALSLTVQNPTDEKLEIDCAALTPKVLRNVSMGSVKGSDFSCAEWVRVETEKLTLPPGRQRNIKIVAAVPKDCGQPNYYATILLRAHYPDGQSAGETKVMLWVKNLKMESEPRAQASDFSIAQTETSKYALTAKFVNIGDVHFEPTCSVKILASSGEVVKEVRLQGEEGLILPLETIQFSEVIDFSKIESGQYSLIAEMEYGKETAQKMMGIEVRTEDGKQVVIQNPVQKGEM